MCDYIVFKCIVFLLWFTV